MAFNRIKLWIQVLRDNPKDLYFKNAEITILEMSQTLLSIPNNLVKPFGGDALSDNFTPFTKRFYGSMAFGVFFIVCIIYSLFINRDDFGKIVNVCITLGPIIHIFGELNAFIFRRQEMLKTLAMCRKIIEFSDDNDLRGRQCIEKWLIFGCHATSILVMIFTLTIAVVVIQPIFTYLFFGSEILLLGLIVPLTNPVNTSGFFINYVHQSVSISLAAIALLAGIMDIELFIIHFLAFYKYLEIVIYDMQQHILNDQTKESNLKFQLIFKKLIEGHNLCLEFLNNFESSFKFYHLAVVAASVYSTVVCLLVIVKIEVTQSSIRNPLKCIKLLSFFKSHDRFLVSCPMEFVFFTSQ